MHYPVMRDEVLQYLDLRPDGCYLDCTAGMGGHTLAIASQLREGMVIANDRDAQSLEMARANCAGVSDRVRFHHGDFPSLAEAVRAAGVPQVDGVLADFGVSRYQLTSAERGFSLQADGPLDMRMNTAQNQTAADIVNFWDERELANLLYQEAEEYDSRRIAREIVRSRPIHTTLQLTKAVERAVPRRGRLSPATKTFLALRRATNEENLQLRAFFDVAPDLLKSGGRLVVISFMSLEDRVAKQRLRELEKQGRGRVLTRHVVKPSEAEVRQNPPSRSAVLRAMEMN
ncbi:MAG: 16S rRNA (cytosine(1402)-N(4))-methyltransferase RsmH [Bryobacterales bacterium]|jgi:16S rRNA (cytosine1402-N4)-methyltransferase|nr:16S rRNA (cytosine(1402)-N(4))-methyltransferase RsmH [Bryobacterales bacterium]